MRVSSRAVIIENGKLLTMFRRKIKEGKTMEYFVIPGGGLEEGESLEENVTRELKEEMNIDIKVLGYLGYREDEKTKEHYFHCEIKNGTPELGGEELDRMTNENYYQPMFVDISELNKINILGTNFVKKAIHKQYENIIND